ncbi:MAG: hypothetical protein K9J12_03065 [Melioribacteraceae bacterium]|nr:hypothetical protein [Melioribacteraceae bacterium]MCF8264515.1 hypothetical protein [Melioribacteraceae bacterium]MCF8412481.1 hypothetical protein [Melioribacteraceae bacterium]
MRQLFLIIFLILQSFVLAQTFADTSASKTDVISEYPVHVYEEPTFRSIILSVIDSNTTFTIRDSSNGFYFIEQDSLTGWIDSYLTNRPLLDLKTSEKKIEEPLEPTQCTGVTKKGERCKIKTSDPSGKCHWHR